MAVHQHLISKNITSVWYRNNPRDDHLHPTLMSLVHRRILQYLWFGHAEEQLGTYRIFFLCIHSIRFLHLWERSKEASFRFT